MILLIDNYDSFTYNLAHLFGELGAEVSVRRNDAIDGDTAERLAPSHLVISPGPGRPADCRRDAGDRAAPRAQHADARRLPRAPGDRRGVRRHRSHRRESSCTGSPAPCATTAEASSPGFRRSSRSGAYHSLAATSVAAQLEDLRDLRRRRDHGGASSHAERPRRAVPSRIRPHSTRARNSAKLPQPDDPGSHQRNCSTVLSWRARKRAQSWTRSCAARRRLRRSEDS